jgi:hypothetical protein
MKIGLLECTLRSRGNKNTKRETSCAAVMGPMVHKITPRRAGSSPWHLRCDLAEQVRYVPRRKSCNYTKVYPLTNAHPSGGQELPDKDEFGQTDKPRRTGQIGRGATHNLLPGMYLWGQWSGEIRPRSGGDRPGKDSGASSPWTGEARERGKAGLDWTS